jgi:altronate dehydratase
MSQTLAFDQVGRLPLPGDNVAIAVSRLEAGSHIAYGDTSFTLSHTVMEGHRFAVGPIEAGQTLLSWELPFGVALRAIEAGEYVCNEGILEALGQRQLDFPLPQTANFEDRIQVYEVNESNFTPGDQVEVYADTGTFMGFDRGKRGVGTRNVAIVLGTSSRTSSFARALAARLQPHTTGLDNVDGVVAIAHTEGGGNHTPNNRDMLLRTLAGFMVHPNVGAVLAVDYGGEPIDNAVLQEFIRSEGYDIDAVPHRFMSIRGGFEEHLAEGERIIAPWLDQLNQAQRTPQPLAHLKLALQCGGSDAFSGISGNPLASWAARELIRHGGAANLAETDELIGAEPYVLKNARDIGTAQRFLDMVERFQARAARHGTSAAGNPSGGNKYRGLYNIVLKSIGAAMKRHPDVRLDYAIDYSQPMRDPGYYFMDSPGNDLESIAGQVAAGCNVIYFVTGNGSITNFPFVPTLKIVTTSERFALLDQDMDVNAGAYQDGVSMDELGRQLFELTVRVAEGERSQGEKAGHSQVQIWRDWPLPGNKSTADVAEPEEPVGRPLAVAATQGPALEWDGLEGTDGPTSDRVGLVLPTSLCSGQIARMCAERLNAKGIGRDQGISRFVTLVHTEGCGVSGGSSEALYARTVLNYLRHPLVGPALLLEHGCEKTHNDYARGQLDEAGVDQARFGWASVQLDGGIEAVMDKVEAHFVGYLQNAATTAPCKAGLGALRLALLNAGPVSAGVATAFAQLASWVVHAGGTVVLPSNSELLDTNAFADLLEEEAAPTLAHGVLAEAAGLHIMDAPSDHWVETLTGLGAVGVELFVAHVDQHPQQGHPLVPLLQVASNAVVGVEYGIDLDTVLEGEEESWTQQILDLVLEAASRRRAPRLAENADFQITRGLLGISL